MNRSTDAARWMTSSRAAIWRAGLACVIAVGCSSWNFAAAMLQEPEGPAPAAEAQEPPSQEAAKPAPEAPPEDVATVVLPTTFIRGARVLTGTGVTMDATTIVVALGKIRGVGDFEVPPSSGGITVDAAGLTIVPGFIDAASDLLLEGEAKSGRAGGSELELMLSVDAYRDSDRLAALSSGVTAMALARSAANAEQGQSNVLLLGYPPRDPRAQLGAHALHFRVGQARDRAGKERETRGLNGLFEGAEKYDADLQKYAKELEEYNEKKAEYDKKVAKELEKQKDKPESERTPSKEKEPKKPREPKVDLGKAAILRALKGELAVVVQVEDEYDVEQVLALRKKFGLRMALRGLSRARAAVDAIAKAGVPVLLEVEAILPAAEFTRTPTVARDLAAALCAAGVDVAYVSGSRGREMAVHLVDLAAESISRGVTPAMALRAITYAPARALGLEHRIGSIAEGMDANLVAFDGDPFSSSARVRWVMVNGEIVYSAPETSQANRNQGSAR